MLFIVNCLRKSDGTFHDCDEILEERLKSHMAAKGVDLVLKEWSPGRDHHMVTLVFCLASNDLTKNITRALDGVSSKSARRKAVKQAQQIQVANLQVTWELQFRV